MSSVKISFIQNFRAWVEDSLIPFQDVTQMASSVITGKDPVLTWSFLSTVLL